MPIVVQSVQPKTFFTYMLEPFSSYEEKPSLEKYSADYSNNNGPAITKAAKFVEANYYSLFYDINNLSNTEAKTIKAIALQEIISYEHSTEDNVAFIKTYRMLNKAFE